MLELEALSRELDTDLQSNRRHLACDRGLGFAPYQWQCLRNRPEVVRQNLASAVSRLELGDDMTRPFDTLEREAAALLALATLGSPAWDQACPATEARILWCHTDDSPSCQRVCLNHSVSRGMFVYCLVSTGRCPREHVAGWADEAADAFDTVVTTLERGGMGLGEFRPRPCCVCWHVLKHHRGDLTALQVAGLSCALTYFTVLLLAAVAGSRETLDRAASQFRRLWKRVDHLLGTEEDNPTVAEE